MKFLIRASKTKKRDCFINFSSGEGNCNMVCNDHTFSFCSEEGEESDFYCGLNNSSSLKRNSSKSLIGCKPRRVGYFPE
ncbi:MAG: hypothetical protein SOZ89_04490 [Peptoniphilaceae bacterium]|nr:hypothetical protein [Peptoniphilaceae bacterium]MDD7383119.1 hypothetical protein [Peptoniphilaceae bacterium]MDY3738365.1 hypothetical protein [Peptoniphilaceae bacterium]